jgi:GNAT superfamily N-acetyltransferase
MRDFGCHIGGNPLYAAAREDHAGGVELSIRLATHDDVPLLREVMEDSIVELQRGFLSPEQIDASRLIMGLDTRLIDDGTYYVVEIGGAVAGCGGWSRRATLYGSDLTPGRSDRLLDPALEPARVRAMYTNPDFARRGVGRMILDECERAAAAEGFHFLELAGTLSGEPLYAAYGFTEVERLVDDRGGAPVPIVRMQKPLDRPPQGAF